MEIEKTMVIAAPIDRVWSLLLDPKVMAGCVPGVQSVQVLSDTEYLADIKVKISFISANFKIKTTILETRPPQYLRCEGTGEDSSVASSVKQSSEMFLTSQPDGTTQLRVKAKADVFGRLGSFGLSVMKTKADRMWEEFGANLAAVLRQPAEAGPFAAGNASVGDGAVTGTPAAQTAHAASVVHAPAKNNKSNKSKWWSRFVDHPQQEIDALRDLRLPGDIYVEVHRGGDVVRILWPSSAPAEVAVWLKDVLRERG